MIVANETTPVAIMLSAGDRHDGPQGRILLDEIGTLFAGSRVLMDRAYEGAETRAQVISQGMSHVVPPKKNRRDPWEYDREAYRRRNEVERYHRRLKGSRRVATRYDKLDVMFFSFVLLAVIFEMLRPVVV